MSALEWQDWSCTVRVVISDGRYADERPAPAVAAVVRRVVAGLMADVERSVSRFRPDSDLARVNACPGVLVPVRPLTVELVDVALAAARTTDGACDPTVGGHLVAAGYDADITEVRARFHADPPETFRRVTADPPESFRRVTSERRRADWTAVRIDRALGRVGAPAGLSLDLGATAKAWTADEAARRTAASLGLPVLVSVGGDLAVAGRGPLWPVSVSELEGEPGQQVGLDRGGLATSSTVGRRWRTPAGEQHHLIDPRTGRPVDGLLRTATVWADSCVEANAMSTAALVWGADAFGRLQGHAARLVSHEGTVRTTSTWPRLEMAA